LSFIILLFSLFWIKSYWDNFSKNEWIPIVFALDVSKSMNVADISNSNNYYTRLEFSKAIIENYVLNNKNNQYGLVIFAWEAISVTPITSDVNVFLNSLSSVDYKNLTLQWTDFSSALEEANNRINLLWDTDKAALILVSDWWDEDITNNNFRELLSDNYNYFVLWVWTNKWWRIILWKDVFWRYDYQTYNWDYVVSKLNEDNLLYLSEQLEWNYKKISNINDVNTFLEKIDNLSKKIYELNTKTYISYSRNIAFISFFFFFLYFLFYLFENRVYLLIYNNEQKK